MKRSAYYKKTFCLGAWILPPLILTGCVSPLESLSCHYQPIRGTLVFTEVDGDFAELIFQPDVKQDLAWFNQYDIEPDDLEMSISNNRRTSTVNTRYNAIINIRTSGNCSPYIVYQGDPVLTH
ncbi:hypothetical protein [Endozoicomonas numazuensis]|uniref:Lipoprotein n=1 Tax=Endozoicomonas numazuensis TaxID=1137799 RepID=A0A081NMB2_9GAMM|nr:hypothetical protein [Endozoicomonas numazuensis]KEQ19585.1 hypothetical protein GZ78_06685 [Endozoicomonas numazuensis]